MEDNKNFVIFFDISFDVNIKAKDFEDAKRKFNNIDGNDMEDFLHERIYHGAYEIREHFMVVDNESGNEKLSCDIE